jgi:exosortase
MQASLPITAHRRPLTQQTGWAVFAVLSGMLWLSVLTPLWRQWMGDSSLSHGPLVPLIAGALLWARKDSLRKWESAAPGGLALLCFFALLFVASVWADIEFLKPLSMVGVAAGAVWFLGGRRALGASIGALGFLAFMIPWPTTLVDKIGFPLQLMSSSYAALFGGLCGLPIHRDGVQLGVMDSTGTKAIYSILVAQKCSGLTSLMVLLALGYLIAYHTEVKLGWRALMVALIIPLTLFTNAVRLTFILLAGAHSSAALAQWIHDHEGPVLIFFCSLGLMAFRHGLLLWTRQKPAEPGAGTVPPERASEPGAPSSLFVIPAQENEIAALPTADR